MLTFHLLIIRIFAFSTGHQSIKNETPQFMSNMKAVGRRIGVAILQAQSDRWELVGTVVWSWTPRGGIIPEAIKIPPIIVEKAQASLLGEIE